MKNISFAIIILLITVRCGQKPADQNDGKQETISSVKLSETQYKAAGITLGVVERKTIGDVLQVNGMLDVPPQNLISVSAPMGGFVKSTALLQGMPVKKGDVLVVLENQEYIQLQQDYLDNRSKLEFLQSEYTRQQELAKENVNSQKVLQQAKSQYESARATLLGLEAKLTMLNITPSSLEKGEIRSTITLRSPISGFVTEVNVNIGQFVNTTDVMFKIVNLEHIHAELQVYEKDIHKIKIGQHVTFKLANENSERTASVYLIGKEISPERTVRIHCHLDKEDQSLLPGMYVTASIETASGEVDVVPTGTIVSFQGENFIFAKAHGQRNFTMVNVYTDRSSAEYTAVKLPVNFNRKDSIVIKGAFTLLGMLKNNEEE